MSVHREQYTGRDQARPIPTLKSIRLKRRLSLRQVAELVGVSHVSIQSYEDGTAMPAADVALRLANLYGIPYERVVKMLERARDGRVATVGATGATRPHNGNKGK